MENARFHRKRQLVHRNAYKTANARRWEAFAAQIYVIQNHVHDQKPVHKVQAADLTRDQQVILTNLIGISKKILNKLNFLFALAQTATGIYCGNVKCSAHEKCGTDKTTKRQKCIRS